MLTRISSFRSNLSGSMSRLLTPDNASEKSSNSNSRTSVKSTFLSMFSKKAAPDVMSILDENDDDDDSDNEEVFQKLSFAHKRVHLELKKLRDVPDKDRYKFWKMRRRYFRRVPLPPPRGQSSGNITTIEDTKTDLTAEPRKIAEHSSKKLKSRQYFRRKEREEQQLNDLIVVTKQSQIDKKKKMKSIPRLQSVTGQVKVGYLMPPHEPTEEDMKQGGMQCLLQDGVLYNNYTRSGGGGDDSEADDEEDLAYQRHSEAMLQDFLAKLADPSLRVPDDNEEVPQTDDDLYNQRMSYDAADDDYDRALVLFTMDEHASECSASLEKNSLSDTGTKQRDDSSASLGTLSLSLAQSEEELSVASVTGSVILIARRRSFRVKTITASVGHAVSAVPIGPASSSAKTQLGASVSANVPVPTPAGAANDMQAQVRPVGPPDADVFVDVNEHGEQDQAEDQQQQQQLDAPASAVAAPLDELALEYNALYLQDIHVALLMDDDC